MNIFQRAYQGLNLSPQERATLRAIQGIILTLLSAFIDAAVQYMSAHGDLAHIDWTQLLMFSLGGVIVAVGLAAHKYLTSHGDAPLGAAVDAIAQQEAATLQHAPPLPPKG